MPLPTPKGKEQKGAFVSRCIKILNDNKDLKTPQQRIAVCYHQWEEAKASADVIVGSGDQETILNLQSRKEEDVFPAPKWTAGAKGQRFGGKKRSELKDSDFLYPEDRSFPIVTPKDVHDAARSFGRSKGKNYEDFKKRLVRKARSKGPAFVAELPDTIKQEHNIKASEGEPLASQYADKAAEMLTETSVCAATILAATENEAFHAKLTEPWVFTKITIAKISSCAYRYHLEYGDIKADEEGVREEIVEMIKESAKEIYTNAQAALALINNPEKQAEVVKPWVFERIVIAKSMACIVKNHLLYGEDPEATEYPAEQDPNNPEVSVADDETNMTGDTGEDPNNIRENYLRHNVFDNKWGADTY